MKFCCTHMVGFFREGYVDTDYGYDLVNKVDVLTPIIKFGDSWHNFNYCPFCGKPFVMEIE